jgi:hypothetical protein
MERFFIVNPLAAKRIRDTRMSNLYFLQEYRAIMANIDFLDIRDRKRI